MVDRDELVELAPHYLAMLLLTFLALGVVRSVASIGFWQEFLVVVVVVFLYRPVVKRLGLAPDAWERDREDGGA